MKKLVLIFIIFFFIPCTAQKLELTQKDKDEFQRRAVRMIELFKEALEIIPSFEGEPILKDKAIKNTLRLFVNGASIELLYANGGKAKMRMPKYLNSLRNYASQGELVNIEIIDFNIDDIKHHPTQLGKYIVEYEFVQLFQKKKNFTPDPLLSDEDIKLLEYDYVDKTTKSGTAIVEKKATSEGTKWIMLLGDIEADKIVVLENKK